MTLELDAIYTAEWYAHDFKDLQPEFNVVADSLVRQFRPRAVVDLGCGPGMVVGRLREHGVRSVGVDGSKHALEAAVESVRPHLQHADITTVTRLAITDVGGGLMPISLVVCTEVAEHLDEKHAAGLVSLLCSAMCPVVFTAAPPGQDGHHHVNCQLPSYWHGLFTAHGAHWDHEATAELKMRWAGLKRLSHMTKNVMVFR